MTTTLYDALRESHEIQRAVFRKLLRIKPGSQERIDLFTQAEFRAAADFDKMNDIPTHGGVNP